MPVAGRGILLVGGCAGVGKTSVARALEERLGVRYASVDERIKTLEEPRLGGLAVGSDWTVSPAEACARLVAKGRVLERHLERWVRQLLESDRPAVLEGEGIQPAWAAGLSERLPVRAVFLVEDDAERVWNTGTERSSSFRRLSDAERRNVVSTFVLYSEWIRREADAHGQPWVPSRPWNTVTRRVRDAIPES